MQIEQTLDALLPLLREARTAQDFCHIIIQHVPKDMKFHVACTARDQLGHQWSDKFLRYWLSPGRHTEGGLAKRHAAIKKYYEKPSIVAKLKAKAEERAAAKVCRPPKPRLTAAEKREKTRLEALALAKERERERSRQYARKLLSTPEGRARHIAANRKHHANNPHRQIANKLRVRVGSVLKGKGARKAAKTMELIGCTLEHLMAHLEAQFAEGMTWENQGEWHIDHIRPCASFDLTDPEQQRLCFHWSNLQPLWASENLAKSDCLDWRC